jgi:hypothetical protein
MKHAATVQNDRDARSLYLGFCLRPAAPPKK